MRELKHRFTIVIVTHNMQQAARVSDRTAFFSVLVNPESDTRTGVLVEYGTTQQIFGRPAGPPHPGLRHRPGGLRRLGRAEGTVLVCGFIQARAATSTAVTAPCSDGPGASWSDRAWMIAMMSSG